MFSSLKGICRLSVSVPILVLIVLCFFFVDLWVAEVIHQYPQWYQLRLFHEMTILGSGPVMLTITFILYVACWVFHMSKSIRLSIAQIGLTLIGSSSIVLVTKITLGRARPMLWFEQHLYGFYGPSLNSDYWSFPSGHAITVMSILWSLTLLYSKYTVIWLVLGFLVVSTRVFLLQHYISDVLTSTYLALIVAIMVRHYYHYWSKWV